MIECWPGRRTSFMKSGMCSEFWSGQGEKERQRATTGKSACFDVQAVVEIEGVKAGPTRSHVALRNLRVERSKTRTGSGSSGSSITSGVADLELALVFEKPGRYMLPIQDITRIRCKYLHQGKVSIEARDSLFLLSAVSQIELERLLDVVRDMKTVKILADSRVCGACKEKAERKKVKQKREQQPPTDFLPNSRLEGDFPASKKQKVKPLDGVVIVCATSLGKDANSIDADKDKVLECIFRKKQLPDLDTEQEQVHLRDLLRSRERDHVSQKLNKMGMFPAEGRDSRSLDVDEEIYLNASNKGEDISPGAEAMKQDNILHKSPVQSKAREKPTSPIRRVIFIDEMKRRDLADAARREAQRIVNERRMDLESSVSVRSGDEKENFAGCVDDVRKIDVAKVKRHVEERRCLDEVLRKVQEGHRRVDDASRRNEERKLFEVEDKRQSGQNESMAKRKESLRKLVNEESKWKEDWEVKREEDRRWTEEKDEKKLKADEERLKKSLDRRLQEEDRRRKEETRREEEIRKGEERRKNCLDRILQEEKRRRSEEDPKRVQEVKQREEEGLKAREAERKAQELKQREVEGIRTREAERKSQELKQKAEEDKRKKEADRKFQEQMQETRKEAEEKLKDALKYFKLEENFQGFREQEDPRKFQDGVKNTVRLSYRDRNRVLDEARLPVEESRKSSTEQRDELDQRKLDEDMRKWRKNENHRRAKEDAWTMPDQERLVLEEKRRRVEEVMNMSKRLHRKMGQCVNDDVEEKNSVTEGTEGDGVHNVKTAGKRGPHEDRLHNIGFHNRIFKDEFPIISDNQRVRKDEEKRERNEGEWFNLTEIFAKPSERARQEELRKQELQRKKAAKAADDQKKKQAQERLKAAKLEAKRLEKLLKEAQKRAKAEERLKHQQKVDAAQEEAGQKVAVNAFERIPRVHYVTYQQYEDSWNVMKMSGKSKTLGYSDIPWPPHDNPLFFEEGDSFAAQRRKLRIALLRWHPDKFVSLCGNRLSPLERDCIEARAKSLAQEVIQWKGKLDSFS